MRAARAAPAASKTAPRQKRLTIEHIIRALSGARAVVLRSVPRRVDRAVKFLLCPVRIPWRCALLCLSAGIIGAVFAIGVSLRAVAYFLTDLVQPLTPRAYLFPTAIRQIFHIFLQMFNAVPYGPRHTFYAFRTTGGCFP